MGMFSFQCNKCGKRDQFDWTDVCIVGLENTDTGEFYYVKGDYDGYGRVLVEDDTNGIHYIFLLEFEDYFDSWRTDKVDSIKINESIVSNDIYCYGEDEDGKKRLCFNGEYPNKIYNQFPSSILPYLPRWTDDMI
jgi:hypothetical protein